MYTPFVMLLAGVVGNIATLPGQTNGVSPFTDFLLGALPISRSQLSLAYLAGTIFSALAMPAVGAMYDRWGSRKMGAAASLFLGASVLAVSFADVATGALALLLPGVAPALLATLVMSFGFFLVRFFGQGTLSMTSRNMVMKWFDHRRGMANAILGPLSAIGFAFAPRFFNTMIVAMGWRAAWQAIGFALVACVVLFTLFTFRDPSPEEQARIREKAGRARTGRLARFSLPEPARPERDYTLAEARRTYSFWLFNAVIGFSSLVSTGFTFHVVSIFAMSGMGRDEALAVFLPATLVAVAVQAFGSVVSDYVRLRSFAVLHMAGVLMMMVSSLVLGPGLSYWLLVFGLGLNTAMMGINGVVVWPRFFGLAHLGRISGESFVWMVAGSAFGPYAYSLSEAFFGSYDAAVRIFACLAAVLLALSWFAHNPNALAARRSDGGGCPFSR